MDHRETLLAQLDLLTEELKSTTPEEWHLAYEAINSMGLTAEQAGRAITAAFAVNLHRETCDLKT